MGRTACTEPQCLYKGALYLYLSVGTGITVGDSCKVAISKLQIGYVGMF